MNYFTFIDTQFSRSCFQTVFCFCFFSTNRHMFKISIMIGLWPCQIPFILVLIVDCCINKFCRRRSAPHNFMFCFCHRREGRRQSPWRKLQVDKVNTQSSLQQYLPAVFCQILPQTSAFRYIIFTSRGITNVYFFFCIHVSLPEPNTTTFDK